MEDCSLITDRSTVKSIPDVLNGQFGQPMGKEVARKLQEKCLTWSRESVPASPREECWLGHVRAEYDSTILRRPGVRSLMLVETNITHQSIVARSHPLELCMPIPVMVLSLAVDG